MSEPEPIALVETVGELDFVVVALRDFLHRSGAMRIVAAVPGAVVDCPRFAPVEVETEDGVVAITHSTSLLAVPPTLPAFEQPPPFEVEAADGEVRGPFGGLQALGEAVRALSAALGSGAVTVATFPTTSPGIDLNLSARAGEPVVVMIGDEAYELDDIGGPS